MLSFLTSTHGGHYVTLGLCQGSEWILRSRRGSERNFANFATLSSHNNQYYPNLQQYPFFREKFPQIPKDNHRFVLVITCFWGWFGKNQPEVFNKILKSTRAKRGWFQNFVKNRRLIFPKITRKKHVITS